MFQLLKIFLGFVWRQKKLLFFILFLTALIFSLRFPWNNLLEKTVRNVQKKSPSSLQTDFENIEMKFFPPGVEFKNLSVNYKRKAFTFDRFRFSVVLSKWIALKQAWSLRAFKDGSLLSVVFWKEKKTLEEEDTEIPAIVYFVNGHSPYLDLAILESFFPKIKISGGVRTHFDFEGHPDRVEKIKANFSLKGNSIRLSKTELDTPLGPLNLPPVFWSEGEMDLVLKEGELLFKTFRLGSPKDNFIIQMKGSGAVSFSFGKVRLNSYNVQLQIDVNKNFKMHILDLMFAGYKEDKGSFYRYLLQMTGRGNQMPNMEKLDKF